MNNLNCLAFALLNDYFIKVSSLFGKDISTVLVVTIWFVIFVIFPRKTHGFGFCHREILSLSIFDRLIFLNCRLFGIDLLYIKFEVLSSTGSRIRRLTNSPRWSEPVLTKDTLWRMIKFVSKQMFNIQSFDLSLWSHLKAYDIFASTHKHAQFHYFCCCLYILCVFFYCFAFTNSLFWQYNWNYIIYSLR